MTSETISTNGRQIGFIAYAKFDDTIIVHELTIFTPFQNQGHGRHQIKQLFEQCNTIYGLSGNDSASFWKKLGATFDAKVDDANDIYFRIKKERYINS